jgi:glucan phosphoethanolaminetransferase (alkaline phosphatase superfamily)
MPMLAYVLAVCWLGFAVVFLTQLRRPLAKKTKTLLLVSAFAMLALAVVQINAARENDLVKVELASINVELNRIKQEIESGHPSSAQELQDRQERLQKLGARLIALRR